MTSAKILYTLLMIVGGHTYHIENNLTADECYNKGRAILNQTTELVAIECEPEGQET